MQPHEILEGLEQACRDLISYSNRVHMKRDQVGSMDMEELWEEEPN